MITAAKIPITRIAEPDCWVVWSFKRTISSTSSKRPNGTMPSALSSSLIAIRSAGVLVRIVKFPSLFFMSACVRISFSADLLKKKESSTEYSINCPPYSYLTVVSTTPTMFTVVDTGIETGSPLSQL